MFDIKKLLIEAAHEMETLQHFADQDKWDDLITRLKKAANI